MQNERKIIGKGRISTVYSDSIYAYKTFDSSYPKSWIKYEVHVQNEIKDKTNLPVLTYELNEKQNEIKMDLICGTTLADRIRNDGYKHSVEDLIMLQKSIFQYENLDLVDAYSSFEKIIQDSNLDAKLKDQAIKSLYSIEKKSRLCHLDFHFENIMYDQKNYYIIDWVNAKLGNPILDIARSYIILKQFAQRLSKKYLKLITNEMEIQLEDVYKVLPAIAAIRFLEMESNSFSQTLISMIKGELT